MVSVPLFTISNIALFCVNFSFINKVLWVPPSNIWTIASPEISSMKGAFTSIRFCSLGFKITQFSGNMGMDLFKNLKQQSLEFITPSNSNTFFMLKTRSTFLWISYTNVQISKLCPCTSIITGMINKILTHWPFPTLFSESLMQIWVKSEVTYIASKKILTWMICLHLCLVVIDILFHLIVYPMYLKWGMTLLLSICHSLSCLIYLNMWYSRQNSHQMLSCLLSLTEL